MRGRLFQLITSLCNSLFSLLVLTTVICRPLTANEPLDIGQFDKPRDFTLRITDPFLQENTDLMQPVIGAYTIKVLPPQIQDYHPLSKRFLCKGLYFKQVGSVIYIDVRTPPAQESSGYYDLSVVLTLPDEGDFSSRQKRAIRYVDSATDVILAIDNSSSMRKNDPRGMRFSAAENFIHLASLSSQINRVAILRFSSSVKVTLPWTSPKRVKNIGRLLSNMRTGNFTNINDTLITSAKLFEDSLASEKVLVLLTDGKNEPDRYRDSHKQLKELGVKVFSVGLSNQSDTKLLRTISGDTGGTFFKAADDDKLLKIYNQIASEIGDFRTMLDGIAEKELKFTINSSDEIVNLNIFGYDRNGMFKLKDPKGKDVPLREISGKKSSTTSIFRLHKPVAGNYTLSLLGGQHQRFNYNINTHSNLFLKSFPLEKKYLKGEVVHFSASLAENEKPVTGTPVTGTIVDSTGKILRELVLYDDGVHGDNHADDGVYCAIWPLDLSEGAYTIVLRAFGKDFTRMDKRSFYVLETGKDMEDYFLASVLPLYLDLGTIEQGHSKISNLRLSFEGLKARAIKFTPGKNIVQTQGENKINFDWKNIEFPEEMTIEPSIASVYSVKFNIPPRIPPGAYMGSIHILLDDQVIEIPVDLAVKGTMGRQIASVAERKLKPKKIVPQLKPSRQQKTGTQLEKKSLLTDTTSGPVLRRPDMDNKKKDDQPLIAADTPIRFEVTPRHPQTFQAEQGQFVSAKYQIINHSSHAGTVQVKLTDGPGSIDIKEINLAPLTIETIYWSWDIEEQPVHSNIDITFSHRSKTLTRRLNWVPPPVKSHLFFYLTLLFLGISAIYYGYKFHFSRKSPDFFLSASSVAHFIIVIVLFFTIVERELKDEDDLDLIEVTLIEPDPPPVEVEKKPKIQEEIEKPVDLPQPQLERKPQQVSEAKARSFEIEPKRHTPELTRDQRQNVQSVVEAKQVELQELERQPDEERTWQVEKKPETVQRSAVISINDRPTRRATLRKSSREELRARQLQQSQQSVEVTRERAFRKREVSESKNLELAERSFERKAALRFQSKEIQPRLIQQQREIDLDSDEIERIEITKQQRSETNARKISPEKQDFQQAERRQNDIDLSRNVETANLSLKNSSGTARAQLVERQKSAERNLLEETRGASIDVKSEDLAKRQLKEQEIREESAKNLEVAKVEEEPLLARNEATALTEMFRKPVKTMSKESLIIKRSTDTLTNPTLNVSQRNWKPESQLKQEPLLSEPTKDIVSENISGLKKRSLRSFVAPEEKAQLTNPEAPAVLQPKRVEVTSNNASRAQQVLSQPKDLSEKATSVQQKRDTVDIKRELRRTRVRPERPRPTQISPELKNR